MMKSEGECKYCKKVFSAMAMSKHLLSFLEQKKANKEGNDNVFLIRASAEPFFVYFEANANAMLETVDDFLRGLWLECCGHMSAFNVHEERYNSYGENLESDERRMNYRLSSLLSPGVIFSYEYDFGTTTELTLKVIEKRKGNLNKIGIIARNDLPDFKCKCGGQAKQICTGCVWKGTGLLCQKCAKQHRCGEEMQLPVVNSPRMGMCGYTGD